MIYAPKLEKMEEVGRFIETVHEMVVEMGECENLSDSTDSEEGS